MSETPARIAVVGAGWWSQGWHLPCLDRNPGSCIAAIVEPNPTPRASKILNQTMMTTAELAQHYGAPVFATFDELLADASVASSLNGVVICCSHSAHAEIGMKSLKAGLHVFMEKPMTVDVREARELTAAAEASGHLAFMVNNSANFRNQCLEAHRLVSVERALGEVQHVLCVMYSPLLWFFEDEENTGWVKPSGSMMGNGFGWGQLSHLLAWVFKVTSLEPCEVSALMTTSPKSGADIHDAALIRCASGATISLSGSCGWPGNNHTQATGKHIDIKVIGSKGILSYGGDDQQPSSGRLELRTHDGGGHVSDEGFLFENCEQDGNGPESLQNFVRACRGEEYVNGADARVGMHAVRALDAMYRSACSGGRPEPTG